MSQAATHRAIEAVWRIEAASVIAGVARLVRDVGLAEELAQDALVAALERWPGTGVPDNPGAWLMTTAKNRARDRLLIELHAILVALPSDPFGGSGDGDNELKNLPIGKWLAAIRQVEESIRRHSKGSGSRAYLDFIEEFMEKEGI